MERYSKRFEESVEMMNAELEGVKAKMRSLFQALKNK